MRVLVFTTLFPNRKQPAHGIFVFQRIAHLARRPGIEVEVVNPVPYFPSWLRWRRWRGISEVPRQEEIGGLTVYHPRYLLIPRISMLVHGLLLFLGGLGTALRLSKRKRFDCLDAHYVYPDGSAAMLLGKLLALPVFVSARGTDINLFPSFRMIRPMIRWTLKQARGIVAVCSALRDAIVALGVPAGRIQVIGNGVDLDRFYPLERVAARERLGLARDGQMIVSVGALIPRKGFQFLIPAFASIASRHPRLRLCIVGEGGFGATLERLADEASVRDRIFFAGGRSNEELRFWYNAADVSALASSREGWPNVLLESLACGTPVVATGVWGVPEVLTSPDLGVLVTQEPRSIAEGLEQALTKDWNREALVGYARTRTWEVVAREVEEYLTARLAQPSGG